MNFFTKVADSQSPFKMDYDTPVFLMGSCFSEVFGKKLTESKFSCLYNPFGTIYNPVSMEKLFRYVSGELTVSSQSIEENNGIFFHFDFHSDMNGLQTNDVRENIQHKVTATKNFLKTASVVILTPGTSIVYERLDPGEVVANCHKVPASFFRKRMLTVDEIIQSFSVLLAGIRTIQKNIKIVLTLSPVRHIRDGLVENNLSKARLLEGIHRIVAEQPDVTYFPSYEIVLDELRDYRFFEKDLIHPNGMAHEVLWDYFCRNMMTEDSRNLVRRVEKLITAKNHRPQFPTHADYIQFCKRQSEEIAMLEKILPQCDFETEKSFFRQYVLE